MINENCKWAQRLILNGHTSDFDTLLQNKNDTCNHHRNMQTLMVKIYEIKNHLNLPIMDFFFERRNNAYNLTTFQEFAAKRKRTIKKRHLSTPFFDSCVWFYIVLHLEFCVI